MIINRERYDEILAYEKEFKENLENSEKRYVEVTL